MGISPITDSSDDQIAWEALAGYNLFLNLGLNKRNYQEFIGCLAATELMDPPQYIKFMQGCERLGLDRKADWTYYTEHLVTDVRHGSGWIQNVMLPLLDSSEEAPYRFLLGAQMRLNTAHDYYEMLYLKLNPEGAVC